METKKRVSLKGECNELDTLAAQRWEKISKQHKGWEPDTMMVDMFFLGRKIKKNA